MQPQRVVSRQDAERINKDLHKRIRHVRDTLPGCIDRCTTRAAKADLVALIPLKERASETNLHA